MCLRRISLFLLSFAVCLIAVVEFVRSAPPATKPVDGLRENTPAVHALVGAKLIVSPGQVIDSGTIVVRDGIIVAAGADVPTPADSRVWDVTGKTIYAGFIDAYSEVAASLPEKSGTPYWNSQIAPQLSIGKVYSPDAAANAKLRGQGITARLIAPTAGIIKGTSALVTSGDEPASAAVLKADVALHVRLTVSRGARREAFPASPMGAVALARQALLDADWYARVWPAYEANRTLPRPEQNDALAALSNYVRTGMPVMMDAVDDLYFLRADAFAREFGLNAAVRGSGKEYRRVDEVAATGRTVIVPLALPKPPNVSTPEAALAVSLDRMMHWDLAPENAARLHRAGVKFAFTTAGLEDAGKWLSELRATVDRGLPPDAALAALTTTPAALFGMSDRLGRLEPGFIANFVVTDGDLFNSDTKLHETWVAGQRYELIEAADEDLRGQWEVTYSRPQFNVEAKTAALAKAGKLYVTLDGTAEKLKGEVSSQREQPSKKAEANEKKDDKKSKQDDAAEKKDEPPTSTKLEQIEFRDLQLNTRFDGKPWKLDGVVRLSATVEPATEKHPRGTWTGTLYWPEGAESSFTATFAELPRKDKSDQEAAEKETLAKGEKSAKDDAKQSAATSASLFPVNLPLGAYGREKSPTQPENLLLKNATVWTCGPQGTLEKADIHISAGKIVAVGSNLKVPSGTQIIDAAGKHVTPGIIDCHSHMASDGGINEGTQAITAEVRIGDFIDPTDIDIYRQLAGGVTTVNVLHGSANPIGGQNQVLKLRWGVTGEAMKFAAAPPGIKFALGENVKQSNWGHDHATRYPQTRMGVEQIMRDGLQAAREYRRRWDDWEKNHTGLPPRRDLELETLAEVLAGKRLIHCHSYRQDEIVTFLRLMEKFGIQVGTLQHVLEGYKVADVIARHGAGGSSFADWWAYKFEVYDAIPHNGALMHRAGVNVSFNSDDPQLARHLNHEAAKAVKYGGVPVAEALKFVTFNPARQLKIDQHVGSIEPGKDADFVLWDGPPLAIGSRCQQTWIDGRKYFDMAEDLRARREIADRRAALVQKILKSGQTQLKADEDDPAMGDLWPRHDEFCHHGDGG